MYLKNSSDFSSGANNDKNKKVSVRFKKNNILTKTPTYSRGRKLQNNDCYTKMIPIFF